MTKEKQIEELYKDVYEAINHNAVIDIIHGGYIGVNTDGLARELYDQGYRKASDVAREIFEEINEIKKQYASGDIDGNTLYVRLYMLEKKYTEEGK